jgi:glycerophosphoryl diester phosphodiesterase
MKIIGHRGASGLALENTIPSIELARLLGVDAIEIDIRKTKDHRLVLCHDPDLSDIAESNARINDSTLADLKKIILNDGQSTIPTLEEALLSAGKTTVIIELKESGCIDLLLPIIDSSPKTPVIIASFKHSEVAALKKSRPDLKVYLAENTRAIEIIQMAKQANADGLDLNFWLLNPLTYFMAKRNKLEVMVYTVNSRIMASFIHWLYPGVSICTNHPEWFVQHPWLKLRPAISLTPKVAKSASKKKKKSSGSGAS